MFGLSNDEGGACFFECEINDAFCKHFVVRRLGCCGFRFGLRFQGLAVLTVGKDILKYCWLLFL